MTNIVGIDLGTTTSAIAIMKEGKSTLITTSQGKRIPSVVAFNRNGEPLVGEAAKRQAALNPENTIFSIKRFLGRRCKDPETQVECARVAYQIVPGPEDDVRISVPQNGRDLPPQEIAASILRKLKQEAEAYLGEPVRQAVLTVPAYFNDGQRQAVKDAGRIAGFEVLRIINEPTATALAYGIERKANETILVVDLGGGTYDVSILEINDGSVTVKACHGDTFLGGDDWDAVITEWLIDGFLRKHGIDLRKDRQALQRVREAAERAKIELSSSEQTTIYLPFLMSDQNGPKHLRTVLTRSRFEELTAPLLERLIEPIQKVLADARLEPADLDTVILVGGASRMQHVQDKLRELTEHEPSAGVDPEEVVVLGAALQAGLLAGELHDVELRDVTPLSLGLETMGGLMTILIPRNTPIPTRRTEIFSTIEDEQTAVDISILQGERQMAADNTKLGVVHLDGIPVAPRGVPQIEVTFEIDEDGILHVSARDIATGKSRALSITSSARLGNADVEHMVQEAERHLMEDQERRNLIEARNVAQQIVYQTERNLQHLNGFPADATCRKKKKEIARQIAELRVAVLGQNAIEIRRLTSSLQRASLVLNQLIYGHEGAKEAGRRWQERFGEGEDENGISIETL